ncbi:MAG: IS110 family transposase, partial [Alphaproteobacteria bacterium]|nr:IS110 family transposase [Alphaproteobacteria bacterium]
KLSRGAVIKYFAGIKPCVVALEACGSAHYRGRDFAAWIGLTPRQHSTGGKARLAGISKQGKRRLRQLLVLGATSLIKQVPRRQGALRDWVADLLARKPKRLVTVALANKLARDQRRRHHHAFMPGRGKLALNPVAAWPRLVEKRGRRWCAPSLAASRAMASGRLGTSPMNRTSPPRPASATATAIDFL